MMTLEEFRLTRTPTLSVPDDMPDSSPGWVYAENVFIYRGGMLDGPWAIINGKIYDKKPIAELEKILYEWVKKEIWPVHERQALREAHRKANELIGKMEQGMYPSSYEAELVEELKGVRNLISIAIYE